MAEFVLAWVRGGARRLQFEEQRLKHCVTIVVLCVHIWHLVDHQFDGEIQALNISELLTIFVLGSGGGSTKCGC